MAARAVIRDVGRALEIPLSRVDQIAKMIPQVLKITLKDALEQSPDFKRAYDSDPEITRLVDIGMRLEGLARNPGTHAAGVVVADKPLHNYIPLQKNGDVVTTQWEMSILEKVGMLKFDFLGLRNLTILTAAVDMIKRVRGIEIDLLKIPLKDEATFALLQRGETKGVFQLESEGIRNLLMRMKPDRFEDVIATCALYRPGPLGGGMVDKYINVKHGREAAEYAHPVMKDVLEETYGVMVYQEQVMRILNRLGGIELASAYKCIKAISKKNMAIIAKYKSQFIEGSQTQGLTEKQAEEIFELIEYFAGYGFNKSHSAAYALVAFQTAYLKAHYPAEFMAALLSSEVDKTDLLVEHIDDCRRMNIEVRPPDVNEGQVGFSVVHGVIRFGLLAIKGVGEKAVEALVAERNKNGVYRSIFDLCERVDSRVVTKSCIEGLIKAGAFDSLKARRSQLMAVLPKALQAGTQARDARESGQGLLFDGAEESTPEEVNQSLPDLPEWTDQEKLANEKALLGIYLSSHPLSEFEPKLRLFRTHEISQLSKLPGRTDVVIGAMVTNLRLMTQQKGRNANQRYARFFLEDLSGSIPCVMFADSYAEYSGQLKADSIWFFRCEVDTSREEVGLIVNELVDLEKAPSVLSGTLLVRIDGREQGEECFETLARIFKSHPGSSPVFLEFSSPDGFRAQLRVGDEYGVICDQEIARQVEGVLGTGKVTIAPPLKTNGHSRSNGNGNGNGNRWKGKPRG
jgi:DNA polymerase-3 subunit alpha